MSNINSSSSPSSSYPSSPHYTAFSCLLTKLIVEMMPPSVVVPLSPALMVRKRLREIMRQALAVVLCVHSRYGFGRTVRVWKADLEETHRCGTSCFVLRYKLLLGRDLLYVSFRVMSPVCLSLYLSVCPQAHVPSCRIFFPRARKKHTKRLADDNWGEVISDV